LIGGIVLAVAGGKTWLIGVSCDWPGDDRTPGQIIEVIIRWSTAGFLSGLARKENKEPASPQNLAQDLQLFVLLRSGIIAERSESNNTGKVLSTLGNLL